MTEHVPFGAIDLVEIVGLMLEGVVESPCSYSTHLPWIWFGVAGQPVCGVCHPATVGRS